MWSFIRQRISLNCCYELASFSKASLNLLRHSKSLFYNYVPEFFPLLAGAGKGDLAWERSFLRHLDEYTRLQLEETLCVS